MRLFEWSRPVKWLSTHSIVWAGCTVNVSISPGWGMLCCTLSSVQSLTVRPLRQVKLSSQRGAVSRVTWGEGAGYIDLYQTISWLVTGEADWRLVVLLSSDHIEDSKTDSSVGVGRKCPDHNTTIDQTFFWLISWRRGCLLFPIENVWMKLKHKTSYQPDKTLSDNKLRSWVSS